jgi:hypothetical protein
VCHLLRIEHLASEKPISPLEASIGFTAQGDIKATLQATSYCKQVVKFCDNDTLMQILHFWTLSVALFRRLDPVAVFRWHLFSWAQSTELDPISGDLHQLKLGYTNQAHRKASARAKTKHYNNPRVLSK